MSKTMVGIIDEHAKTMPRDDGHYGCGAKGCDQIYGSLYPERIVVTAHVVNRLNAAGFGSRHDAWAEGYGAGKVVMAELMSPTHFATEKPNPHPVTQ